MAQLTRFSLLFALLVLVGEQMLAQRVAWVVGNSEYVEGDLPNPVNDAQLVSDSLAALGFEVRLDKNLVSLGDFWKSFDVLAPKIEEAEVFLFYYAGHGIQIENQNYLIPTGAALEDERMISNECFEIKKFITEYEKYSDSTAFVVVLDACRVNPFERSHYRSGSGAGLARLRSVPEGTLVAYSTEYGTTAADGDGAYSAYAQAFASQIGEPGISIQDTFQQIRKRIIRESNKRQVPVEENMLTDPLILRMEEDVSLVEFDSLLKKFREQLRAASREYALWDGVTDYDGLESSLRILHYYRETLLDEERELLDELNNLELVKLSLDLRILDNPETKELEIEEFIGSQVVDPSLKQFAEDFINLQKCLRLLDSSEIEFLSVVDRNTVRLLDIKSARLEWCSRRQARIQIPSFKKHFAEQGEGIPLFEESYSGEYADLIETMTTSELILAVESDLWPSGYEGPAIANLDEEEVIWLFNQYGEFYQVQEESKDRIYGMMTQLKMFTLGFQDEGDWHVGLNGELGKKSKWIEEVEPALIESILGDLLSTPIDYENLQHTDFFEVDFLEVVEKILDSKYVKLRVLEDLLLAFFKREFAASYRANSTTYLSMYDLVQNLIFSHRMAKLNGVAPNAEELAQAVKANWSGFRSNFLDDRFLNDLDFELNYFIELQWYLEETGNMEISPASYRDLNEFLLQLLILTSQNTSCEYIETKQRLIIDGDEKVSSGLLELVEELWVQLQVGPSEFEALGLDTYHESLICLYGAISYIEPDDLNCEERSRLIQIITNIVVSIHGMRSNDGASRPEFFDIDFYLDLYLLQLQRIYRAYYQPRQSRWSVISMKSSCDGQYAGHPDPRYNWYNEIFHDDIRFLMEEKVAGDLVYLPYEPGHSALDYADLEEANMDVMQLVVFAFRTEHQGRINVTEFPDLLQRIEFAISELAVDSIISGAEQEYAHFLYEAIHEIQLTSERYALASEDAELNTEKAFGELRRLIKEGVDFESRAVAAFFYAQSLQNHYHSNHMRKEQAIEIIESGRMALRLMRKMQKASIPAYYKQNTLYLLAEELSCNGQHDDAISIRREMIQSEDCSIDAKHQYAQDNFLDAVLAGAENLDELYQKLMGAYDYMEWFDGGENGVSCEYDAPCNHWTIQYSIPRKIAVQPVLEFEMESGDLHLLYKTEEGTWESDTLSHNIIRISTYKNSEFVGCWDNEPGFVELEGSELIEENILSSERAMNEFKTQLSLTIPGTLVSDEWTSLRVGFYTADVAATNHTQDLKYLTFLQAVEATQ